MSVAVPPSEVMRNTVRFEGLAVLLFFVNEEEERSQTGVSATFETVLHEHVFAFVHPFCVLRLFTDSRVCETITSVQGPFVGPKFQLFWGVSFGNTLPPP